MSETQRIEILKEVGWSDEGAQFLLQHAEETRMAKLLKRFFPIRIKREDRHIAPKEKIPAPLRWEIWERDNFTCKHCGTHRDLTIDHIIPESRGGTLHPDNLQTLCRKCNSRKGTRTK